MARQHVVEIEKKSLKRVLGISDLFAIGYGDVGSSIYYALGVTALFALGATPIALAIAGFIFICTALTYAEMATTFPEAGGAATFTRHAFNDLISFIAGWGLLLDYIVTIAISAFTIPPYLAPIIAKFGLPAAYVMATVPHLGITIGIIGLLLVINILGVKLSTRLSWILAIGTIFTQLLIITFAALFLINIPYLIDHLRIGVEGADWSPSWSQFVKGTAMAMVSYIGIESIAQLAEETKQPALVIPRAIHRVMGVLVALYIGISFAALSAVPPQELGTTYLQDPVVGIVRHFPFGMGDWLAPWVGLLAAVLLLIAANAGLIGCSRLIFSMGEHYQVPHFFYRVHQKYRTPHLALIIFALLACILVVVSRGQMMFLADIYAFGAMIAFFSVHSALLVLRVKRPQLERPYRAPLNIPIGKGRSLPLTALIGAVASFAVWIVIIITKTEGRYGGFAWIIGGLVMYFLYRRAERIAPMERLYVEKIKIPEYKPMALKNILVTTRATDTAESMQLACQLAKHHSAKVTAIAIIEMPHAMPIFAPADARAGIAEVLLKRAEAIAGEYGVTLDCDVMRARSLEGAILSLVAHEEYDLVIIGGSRRGVSGSRIERRLYQVSTRIWFCTS